jgi:putative transposase
MITYQFKLFPSKIQQEKLWLHANKMNFLYNTFLNERIENQKLQKEERKKITRFTQQEELVDIKKVDPVTREIHSQVLQQVPLRLDLSFKSFFKKNGGFPKFRSSKNFFGILYSQSGFSINKNIFKTKVYGEIRFLKHREIKGTVKQVFISNKDKSWTISIITDYEKKSEVNSCNLEIGIDIGLTNIVVDNLGNKIRNATHSKYFDKQISKLQSKRDKLTKKNSRRNRFLSKRISKLHSLKVRKINDFQHKLSKSLAQKHNVIYAENLSSKKMSEGKNTGLNKAIRNAKFGQLLNFLSYKTERLVLVNPFNTSKTCNSCGFINDSLKLSDREINCKNCNTLYDRDHNAAKNIFCLGQAIIEKQCTELTIQEALAFKRE